MTELRISSWPGGLIPVPELYVPEVRLEGDILDYSETAKRDRRTGLVRSPSLRRIELPEELYLRELGDLNLESHEKIAEFSKLWGPLGSPGLNEIAGPGVVGPNLERDARCREQMQAVVAPHLRSGQTFQSRAFIHIKEFQVHARLLRDLTRAWAVVSGSMNETELVEEWESEWIPASGHLMSLQLLLVHYVNHALQPFHVRLGLVDEKGSHEVGKWDPSLFSALCLQLMNQIIAGQPYRRCEKCGRQFAIQRGRAEAGQYRRDGEIKYCSKHCAKAQAQRDLYNRQKEARRLHDKGSSVEAIAEALGTKTENVQRWIVSGRRSSS